jgi:hypothetical protein
MRERFALSVFAGPRGRAAVRRPARVSRAFKPFEFNKGLIAVPAILNFVATDKGRAGNGKYAPLNSGDDRRSDASKCSLDLDAGRQVVFMLDGLD